MKTILIVDDEPDIVELLMGRLQSNHYNVIAAVNGKKGVESARKHHPDLILMDVLMPEMTGYEAIRELKCFPDTRDIPVIILTGLYDNDHADATGSHGIDVAGVVYETVGKPFHPQRLLDAVKKYI